MIALAALLLSLSTVQSPPLEAQRHEEALPSALAAPVASHLASSGVRATVKNVTIEFWWVKGMPIAGSAAPSWTDAAEGSLVGAVRIGAEFRDVRGRVIKPGVYTLRYGIQPSNGDHLGVSPYREFLLLSPAAIDTDPGPRGHDGAIEMSTRTAGGSHPAVWSIDPPLGTAPVLSSHATELGHTAVIVEVPVTREGKPAGVIRFGVVLIGKIDA